jgi:ribosomal-protein-alanine N-acetyltransferase
MLKSRDYTKTRFKSLSGFPASSQLEWPLRSFEGWYHRRMVQEGETKRMIQRQLALADAPQIQKLFPHWEIVRYLVNSVPWPYPADGAEHFIRNLALPSMERGEAWHWTLRLKTSPEEIVGCLGLRRGEENNRGFWLGLQWRGQGLMSEACEWASDFWFEQLGFPVLRTGKAIENTASRRISEKHGMRLVGVVEKDYVSGRLPSEIWEITAEEWRAWKAGAVREQL